MEHPQQINPCMAFAARGRPGQSRMVPSRFKILPAPAARARQHLLGDDGLAPYISRLVCRSFNVLYQCCFRRRKILESVRRLSEYLLARLVDICHSTRNRIYNEMTKLSMTAMSSEEGVTGLSIRRQSVVVSSGRVLHFAKQISFLARKEGCVI